MDEAIRLNPNNQLAYHMRGKVHTEFAMFSFDDQDQAFKDLEKAIKLNPKDPEVYISRANLWKLPVFPRGKKKALKDYDKAIKLFPGNAAYYLGRSNLKQALKDMRGAKKDLLKAQELDPSLQ